MFGIWVAVNATTQVSTRSRYSTLKLWKSRPAAPTISTRVLTGEEDTGLGGYRARQPLADAGGDRFELEARARRILQHVLGGELLALRPELAQLRAGLGRGE